MWSRRTCGACMDWFAALDWVNRQNALYHCGFSDWRLPNSCELTSLSAGHLALLDEIVPTIETRAQDCEPGNSPVSPRKLRSVTTHNGLSKRVEADGRNVASTTEPELRSLVGVGGGFRATSAIYPGSDPMTSRITRFYRHVPMVRNPQHRA